MIYSRFDSDLNLMVHTGTGQITVEQIISATRLWFSHPEFDNKSPVLWEISDGLLDLSFEEMRGLYQQVRGALTTKRAGGKTAWVHESGIIRAMIEVVRDEYDWGSQWRTFASKDEATEWCCRDD